MSAQIYFEADAETNVARFEALYEQHDAFVSEIGQPVEWDPMEGTKAARIMVRSSVTDIDDRAHWPEITDWLLDMQIRLRKAVDAAGEGYPRSDS